MVVIRMVIMPIVGAVIAMIVMSIIRMVIMTIGTMIIRAPMMPAMPATIIIGLLDGRCFDRRVFQRSDSWSPL